MGIRCSQPIWTVSFTLNRLLDEPEDLSYAMAQPEIKIMTVDELRATLADEQPPATLRPALQALWQAGKGNWDASHAICQESDKELDWVHAWLHRQEGDLSNANYWYRRAERSMSSNSLEEEWDEIAEALLKS